MYNDARRADPLIAVLERVLANLVPQMRTVQKLRGNLGMMLFGGWQEAQYMIPLEGYLTTVEESPLSLFWHGRCCPPIDASNFLHLLKATLSQSVPPAGMSCHHQQMHSLGLGPVVQPVSLHVLLLEGQQLMTNLTPPTAMAFGLRLARTRPRCGQFLSKNV